MALRMMVPPPMHTMFEKESSTIAIDRHFERKTMVSVEVPPTTTGSRKMNCNC